MDIWDKMVKARHILLTCHKRHLKALRWSRVWNKNGKVVSINESSCYSWYVTISDRKHYRCQSLLLKICKRLQERHREREWVLEFKWVNSYKNNIDSNHTRECKVWCNFQQSQRVCTDVKMDISHVEESREEER